MRKYILTNVSTGETYTGIDLEELYKEAAWDKLPGDKLTLKSVVLPYTTTRIQEIIELMMSYDPNGTWDETDLTCEDDVKMTIHAAIFALNRWAAEESDQITKYGYYKLVFELEELLG